MAISYATGCLVDHVDGKIPEAILIPVEYEYPDGAPVAEDVFPGLGQHVYDAYSWAVMWEYASNSGRKVIRTRYPYRQMILPIICERMEPNEVQSSSLLGWSGKAPSVVFTARYLPPVGSSIEQELAIIEKMYLQIREECLTNGIRSLSAPLLGVPAPTMPLGLREAYNGASATRFASLFRNVFLKSDINVNLFLPTELFLKATS